MSDNPIGLLQFHEAFLQKPWGGQRLATHFGKNLPADKSIGEAWLVADHPAHESVVSTGPHAGTPLSALMASHPAALLGSAAKPRADGRFPLLLKLLDARETLSVQVHPDDALAAELGESDGGKTESWYILAADPGSPVYIGTPVPNPGERVEELLAGDDIAARLPRRDARPGEAYFLPAGTLHAIGGGLLLAEIQQNSDLTYRVHDWGRVDAEGRSRELHLAKAARALRATGVGAMPRTPLQYSAGNLRHDLLHACPHFAVERIGTARRGHRDTGGRSFHILLGLAGLPSITAGADTVSLAPGCAVLVAGAQAGYGVEGGGTWLDYYVPDPVADLESPLRAAGLGPAALDAALRDFR